MKIMYCRKDFSSMTSNTILDKIDGKFIPPTSVRLSNQGQENGAFWILRGFILDLGRRVAPSAAGITVLYLRTGGRMGQRKGHDLLFLFG